VQKIHACFSLGSHGENSMPTGQTDILIDGGTPDRYIMLSARCGQRYNVQQRNICRALYSIPTCNANVLYK